MANGIYEVRFILDESITDTGQSLSSKIDTAQKIDENKTKKPKIKTAEEIAKEKRTKIAGGVTTTVATAAKVYGYGLQVRNMINTNKQVNSSIGGNLLQAQVLQVQTQRNDQIAGYISTVINPMIAMGASGFVSGGGVGGLVGAGVGLVYGGIELAIDLVAENQRVYSQTRAYNANRELQNYINGIEREKLIKTVGYYR